MSDDGYFHVPTRPCICKRCGAVVDEGFIYEHNKFHQAKADAPEHWLCEGCGMPQHRCDTWGDRVGRPGEKCCAYCEHTETA